MNKKEPCVVNEALRELALDAIRRGFVLSFCEYHIPKKYIGNFLMMEGEMLLPPPPRIYGIGIKWIDGDELELVRWDDSVY